jgi:hypothetical protein
LKVVEVNPETNEIFIRGAVPGATGNLILLAGAGDLIIETETLPVVEEQKAETSEQESENQEVKTDEAVVEEKPVEMENKEEDKKEVEK